MPSHKAEELKAHPESAPLSRGELFEDIANLGLRAGPCGDAQQKANPARRFTNHE
jgi:hypothetical protein